MRKIISSILLLFLAGTLNAQHALQLESRPHSYSGKAGEESVFTFSAGLESGVLLGMLQEWVYVDRESDSAFDDVLSRLDWQNHPLFYLGLSGSLMLFPRFFIGFGGWLGIPGLLGFMEDRDWDEITGAYEIFSHHDNFLQNACFLDLNVGYSLIYEKVLTLNAIIGFNLRQTHMSGQNGWQERYDSVPPGGPYTGEVINYEQNVFITYLALETLWNPFSWLSVGAFFSFSPWLTFAYCRDIHVGGNYFQDLPAFGIYLSGVVNLVFHLGGGFALCLKNFIHWTPPFSGNTYTDGFLNTACRGGASLLLYGVSFSLHFGFGT